MKPCTTTHKIRLRYIDMPHTKVWTHDWELSVLSAYFECVVESIVYTKRLTEHLLIRSALLFNLIWCHSAPVTPLHYLLTIYLRLLRRFCYIDLNIIFFTHYNNFDMHLIGRTKMYSFRLYMFAKPISHAVTKKPKVDI